MTEKTTRTCDGCGADLASDFIAYWVLSRQGFGARLCEDTADKHLCMTCADRLAAVHTT